MLARPGPATHIAILCAGMAAKFFDLPDGRRQILLLRRPGQFLLGCSALSESPAFSALAFTDVAFAQFERTELINAAQTSTAVVAKLAKVLADDHDEVAQLTIDLGRRSAQERLCHLFCKFVEWSKAPISDNQCTVRVPLRQEDIADYLGLTTAHVNRTISAMRRENLITVDDDQMRINDYAALRALVA
jgi:CRP-like cAMP-binding protein